ncbi:MAG TPA: DUF3943 domain-containing protein [Polyangiaceae bacterium]|nr:DUF3943 domain-containing protein [Polyangiaceae bacterium]
MRGWPSLAVGAALACALPVPAAHAQSRGAEWSPRDDEALPSHHLRSWAEMGGGLLLGTAGYWALMRRNAADWDNPRPLSRFERSSWVLDNNSIGVNFLGHPASGGLSYSFARANHYGVPASFAYSFTTSFLWEFIIEFKEKVSFNDVLVTPGAGLPLGEFFYKLGLYLDSGHHDSWGYDVARALLGSGVALDRWLDGRPPPKVATRDNLGFSAAIWHDFSARYGATEVSSAGESSYARYSAGVTGRLVTLEGYGKASSFGRGFYGAELSSFELEAEASRYGWGLWSAADTMLAGYHAQRFVQRPSGLSGGSVSIGTSVGFAYLRSAANRYASVEAAVSKPGSDLSYHVPNRREQYGAWQLPGLALDVRLLGSWGSFEASARVQPSFAGVGAVAFYDWSAENPDAVSKHILHRQGYFYGWGGVGTLSARLALGVFRGGVELLYGAYDSQDGWDRHPEQLSVDVPARGDIWRYRASLGVAPRPDLTVAFELGKRRFHSEVAGFERTARATERGVSAVWRF